MANDFITCCCVNVLIPVEEVTESVLHALGNCASLLLSVSERIVQRSWDAI